MISSTKNQVEDSKENGPKFLRGLTLLLVVLGGIGVSVFFLLHSRANYEEIYNLKLVTFHKASTASLGTNDDPMPLYFLLEWAWIHFTTALIPSLGKLVAARVLSLLFYPLSVVAMYFVGLSATKDRKVSIAASIFLALSPFMLWYSSRATMYSMLVFAVLINQYFFTKLLGQPKWWHWFGYCCTSLLGIGIHFFFGVILLVQLVLYIVKMKRKPATLWLLVSMVITAVALAVWIHYSADRTALWHYLPYTSRPSATNTFIIFVEYLFGFQSVTITTLLTAFWPLLVVVALLAIQKYVSPPVAIQYSFWATAAPVLGMFFLAWVWKPLFLSSYLIIALAPLMLLLGWYFVALKLRTLYLACYGLMVLMAVMLLVEVADPSWALMNDYLGLASTITRVNFP